MNDFKEIEISRSEAMKLMKKKEVLKLEKQCNYYDHFKPGYKLEYIFNVGLKSLSVRFMVNGELEYWFLFRDLSKPTLNKLLNKHAA